MLLFPPRIFVCELIVLLVVLVYEFSLILDLSSIIEVDDSLSTLQMISALQVRVSHLTV